MKKRITVFLLCLLFFGSSSLLAFAHNRNEHDEDIEYILFGNKTYKVTHPAKAACVQAIEDATYLAVDQFNGSGAEALKNLQDEKIPGIPKTIAEFDFTANFAHRRYTHRGWNVQYDAKANWPVRQQILINTVRKELFSTVEPSLSWFPWLSERVYAEQEKQIKMQCESFCILLYYTHILGDHLEADKYTALAYVAPLTNLNDKANPGVVPDLIQCSKNLFSSQSNSYIYFAFLEELEDLKERSDTLTRSEGGINTDEEFVEYHKCAEDLYDALATYIPKLLKNEPFFYETFFK